MFSEKENTGSICVLKMISIGEFLMPVIAGSSPLPHAVWVCENS